MPEATGRRDDEPAGRGEPITTDTLSRHLAAEALLRESSEMRTATTMKRYFRLTIALVGINALVAGATMMALWARTSGGPGAVARTIAPAGQPGLPAVLPTSLPVPTPAPALAPAPPAPVPTAAPLPAPSSEPDALTPRPRPRRPAAKVQVAHKPVPDTKTAALDSVVERW